MEHMLADAVRDELEGGLASARLPLIMSVPEVRAATLHRYFLAEAQLADATAQSWAPRLWPHCRACNAATPQSKCERRRSAPSASHWTDCATLNTARVLRERAVSDATVERFRIIVDRQR
jgi:hypothetical protein